MVRKIDPVTAGSAGLLGLLALAVVWASVRPESRHVVAGDKAPPAAWTAQTSATPQPSASATASPRPADERFVIKRVLPISGPIKYGEWHWDEKGVPAGPIAITVDLDARVISVFRGGYEIGAAAVLLGTQEKPTPTGVFPIKSKERFHTSNLYDAPMPYMQRLTDDGITLHATKVEWGYASHGCIGMPMQFARKVFGTTHVGDKVIITRGETAKIGDSISGG
jgi:lipoprotein-anchoring transpeptidase ErfK/SrfK